MALINPPKKAEPNKILYLVVMENAFQNNIFHNQVLPVLSAFANVHGLFVNPILEASHNRIGLVRGRQKFKHATVFYSPFPTYFFFSQWFVLPFVIIWACFPTLFFCIKQRISVIHARNLMSSICAVMVSKIIKVSVIVDMRGVHPDEGVLIGRWRHNNLNYRIHKILEAWVFRSATKVTCISPNLCAYVKSIEPSSRPVFVPAMVNPQKIFFDQNLRQAARKKLKIEKDAVCLIYTGTLGAWHSFDALRKQVISISEKLDGKKIVVIILANQSREFIVQKLGLDQDVVVQGVKPNEVNFFLNAADIGLLPARPVETESDRIVFDVMISSKAEEYLCAGLDVCANPVIPFFQKIRGEQRTLTTREDVAVFYQKIFSSDSVIGKINELYQSCE